LGSRRSTHPTPRSLVDHRKTREDPQDKAPGRQPAIIDRDTFDGVGVKRDANTRATDHGCSHAETVSIAMNAG